MNPTLIASQWSTLCQSARAIASRLTQGISAPAAELIQEESGRFCRVDSPQDKDALESAYTRRMALSARLTAIARADALARACPESASEILSEVRQFCEGDLPATSDAFLQMQQRNIELTRTIAEICEADLTARLGTRT